MRRPPVIAGKYVLLRLLGRGAMGAVYEAMEADTGIRVAVKILRGVDHGNAAELATRFEREARAIRTILSKHVPRVLDAGRDSKLGFQFLVMEFLKGDRLDKLRERMDGFSTDLVLRIAAQTCDGLAAAHRAGVIHRDIKPQNIFLAAEGPEVVVKVLDFGIAKLKQDSVELSSTEITHMGRVLGSPRYMAPEQARAHRPADQRVDIWAVGVVMYELLSGNAPHAECKGIADLMVALVTTPPTPLREKIRWVSSDFEHIVDRALQMDPADRYQTIHEMLAEIDLLLPYGRAINSKMIVPTDAMPTAVLPIRLRMASVEDLRSFVQGAPMDEGVTIVDSSASEPEGSLSEELETCVLEWVKKRKAENRSLDEPSSDEDDELATAILNPDDFPTSVLSVGPTPGNRPALIQPAARAEPEEYPVDVDEFPQDEPQVLQDFASAVQQPTSLDEPEEDFPTSEQATNSYLAPARPSPVLDEPPQNRETVPPAAAVRAPVPDHATQRAQRAMQTVRITPVQQSASHRWLWIALLAAIAGASVGAWVGWSVVSGRRPWGGKVPAPSSQAPTPQRG